MILAGKTVLLTGAAGGIGTAIAEQLAGAGARLILSGRNLVGLEELAARLPGTNHICFAADIHRGSGRANLINRAAKEGIDILINNAGTNELALFAEMDDERIEQMLDLNLLSPILLCKAALPLLQGKEQAAIVNVGSILGSIGFAGSTIYCAGKFALRGFSEALRRELADSKIRVIYFAPRATQTSFNDDRIQAMNEQLGTAVDDPQDVARQLLGTLQKEGSSQRYLGWPEKFFVRLNGLLPGVVDRALKKQLPVIKQHAGAPVKQERTGE